MNASPVLKYLAKLDLPSPRALGSVSMLRSFAASVGKNVLWVTYLVTGFVPNGRKTILISGFETSFRPFKIR
jgi:hypothetical protein